MKGSTSAINVRELQIFFYMRAIAQNFAEVNWYLEYRVTRRIRSPSV